jgi:hypothetical protein
MSDDQLDHHPRGGVKKKTTCFWRIFQTHIEPGPQILSVEKFPLSPSNSTPEAGEVPINLPIFQKWGKPPNPTTES